MHLLREGQFDVAATFIAEANARPPPASAAPGAADMLQDESWEQDFAAGTSKSQDLQRKFHDMYTILQALRENRDLGPAIQWARQHRSELESRGSNLEFELCRLHFITLFTDPSSGLHAAHAYASSEFSSFHSRYTREIHQLVGALAFWQNIPESPYRWLFSNEMAWEEVASSFTKEFCSLLGLSADSPLYIAATAGAIAIPQLMKLQVKRKGMKTEWSTTDELPVSLPAYFHMILFASCRITGSDMFSGRNPTSSSLSLPLHLRLPSGKGSMYGRQPTNDDHMWARHFRKRDSQHQERASKV